MYLCRLCSSENSVVDVFHQQLESGETLRYCILLASGIDIRKDDPISTMVCHRCCEIAVKLHKYRINAITNDKALKQQHGQPYEPPIMDPYVLMKSSLGLDANFGSEIQSKEPLNVLTTSLNVAKNNAINTTKVVNKSCSSVKVISYENNNVINDAESDCSVLQVPPPTESVVNKHPSIKKILREHHNLIIPEEVYCEDISPLVSIDNTELNQWYSRQRRDSYTESISSNNQDDNSSDSDSINITSRLRKRTAKRIIIDSDSEDDQVFKKVQRTISTRSNSDNAKIRDVVKGGDLKQKLPEPVVKTKKLVQTDLKKLFTDFNKYGINFENSEPLIETPAIDSPPAADSDNDIICLSDEPSILPADNEPTSINLEVKSLFEKHYSFHCKPKKTIVRYKAKGAIALENMGPELKKYPIPVEIDHSTLPTVRFVQRSSNESTIVRPFWTYKDCIDVNTPNGQVLNATSTINDFQNNTIISTIKPTETQSVNLVYGSLVTSNSVIHPVILNTSTYSVNNGILSTSMQPTTQIQASNAGVLNGMRVYNSINNGIVSNSNSTLSTTNDALPPLLPLLPALGTTNPTILNHTLSVPTQAPRIVTRSPSVSRSILKPAVERTENSIIISQPNTSDITTPSVLNQILTNSIEAKIPVFITRRVPISKNVEQKVVADPKKIKILPKPPVTTPVNTYTSTWHKVQTTETSETPETTDCVIQKPTTPPQPLTVVAQEQPITQPTGMIRVKNLSELLKN